MKTKKFGKKLVLNKDTIANFSNEQLGNVKGGIPPLNTHDSVCSCLASYGQVPPCYCS
jgi:hypothetical protein